MADLKLPMIPDRTPVKLTINLSPDLKVALDAYAAEYARQYEVEEPPPADLVPAMLAMFLESDREFVRRRRHLP